MSTWLTVKFAGHEPEQHCEPTNKRLRRPVIRCLLHTEPLLAIHARYGKIYFVCSECRFTRVIVKPKPGDDGYLRRRRPGTPGQSGMLRIIY